MTGGNIMIVKHKIEYDNNQEILCIYLDMNLEEFAKEYNTEDGGESESLRQQISNYLKEKGINFTGNMVKIIGGTVLMGTLLMAPQIGGETEVHASSQPQTTYRVQSGDSLSVIASRNNTTVDAIKDANNITRDTIFIGETLIIPTQTTTATYHTVSSGENLSVIAHRYGVTVNQLRSINNLTSDIIHPGQTLMLRANTEVGTYTVRSGDSLWTIARNYGMSINELRQMNNISGDTIHPGQQLRVLQAPSPATYTVREGDSLWTIARAHNTTVDEVQRLNNLTSDRINPGQTLRVPRTNQATLPPETTPEVREDIMIRVRRSNGVVQNIELEEYVIGVVASEMPPFFNDEAFKAQALAARTYAVNKMNEGVILLDTAAHQVYQDRGQLRAQWGTDFDRIYSRYENAVYATKGQVITHNGSLINAMYFSTSNGRTENPQEIWGGSMPYMRSVDSTYDLNSPEFRRVTHMSYSEFRSRLGLPSTASLHATVTDRTAGDAVRTINISGRTFSGEHVRSRLGLRSMDFDLRFEGTRVAITQRGWGHRVGMSQYGAHFMGENGFTYRQIINHYYHNVNITQL